MADDVRRWSVTYTKQIKQKRKVYQDGFLELHSSNHKVKLYDDCDELLDSKIVKLNDGAVKSGETLTFGAYLVDIGDPHGEHKPIPNLILQRRDKTITDRDSKPSNNVSKGRSRIFKASSINLSPSQKIIREFKRREENKYRSSPSCPDTGKDDSTEWQVLYTTQLTQKAKKFHDGILKVATSGLRGRQATLYDETRKHLDNKFLRNEEIVGVGESLRFDGHIVDIVELRDHKPLKDTNFNERNCYTQNTVQSKIDNEHLTEFKKREINKSSINASGPYSTKTNLSEWDVMYTTQITQKAKKFHDGVLKLASCGSQGRQEATLLAVDGTVLSHKYLKLSEDINSGSFFNMPNYLVEVGEPRKYSEENETPKIRSSDADNVILSKRIPARRLSNGELSKRALSLQDTNSKARNSVADKVISTTISKNKPLRDAHSILSFLKKPSTEECVAIVKVHLEKQQDSCSTRLDVAVCDEETRKIREYSEPISNCKPANSAISLETIITADADIMVNKQQNDTEYGYSVGLKVSDIKRSICDEEFTTTKYRHSSPTEEPQAMDTFGKNINSLPSIVSATCCESTEAVDVRGHPEVMSSKARPASNFNEPAKETKDESNTEIYGGKMMIPSSMHDGNVRKGFENTNSANADFPSFDLGID